MLITKLMFTELMWLKHYSSAVLGQVLIVQLHTKKRIITLQSCVMVIIVLCVIFLYANGWKTSEDQFGETNGEMNILQ